MGKEHIHDICNDFEVDAWKYTSKMNINAEDELIDKYVGKEKMRLVSDKKYLGDIVTSDLKNSKNLKDRTNKGVGNVNKIHSALNERLY